MNNLFTQLARKAVANSSVREGRTLITTDELMSKYPDGITITEFDMLQVHDRQTGELKSFPTLAFAEDSTKYINGGGAITKIVEEWLDHFEGDIESCNAALKAAGGAKIRICAPIRTNSGNSYIPVDIP